jgi:hypothetical protein
MKIATVVLVLALTGSTFAQTAPKLSDAYGVAAVRTAIQFVNDWDKAGALLNELEAQITSPAEQESYDGLLVLLRKIRNGQRAVNEKLDARLKTVPEYPTISIAERQARLNKVFAQAEADNAAYAASLQPCFLALKTNLQHRDGTMPAECK